MTPKFRRQYGNRPMSSRLFALAAFGLGALASLALAPLALASPALASPATAGAAEPLQAILLGQAVLPAETTVEPPSDAPTFLASSGKFVYGDRSTKNPAAGSDLPIIGQPVQGLSGIKTLGNGRYLMVADNGFGARNNSADAMLMLHEVEPDFETGTVTRHRTLFLNDSQVRAPFPIAMEGSESRYLTGADFDTESFQVLPDGRIAIGEEFGPAVFIVAGETGTLELVHKTVVDGVEVRSPDHWRQRPPSPHEENSANLKRSRGFEAMGLRPAFSASAEPTLWAMLEGPIWLEENSAYETVDGKTALRLLELDAQTLDDTALMI